MKLLSFSISLLGILLLLLMINFIEVKEIPINEITSKNLNEKIKITGKSSNVKTFNNNFTTFSINNKEQKITVICTCPNVKNNQNLEVTGKITKYQEFLQIQADLIKINF